MRPPDDKNTNPKNNFEHTPFQQRLFTFQHQRTVEKFENREVKTHSKTWIIHPGGVCVSLGFLLFFLTKW